MLMFFVDEQIFKVNNRITYNLSFIWHLEKYFDDEKFDYKDWKSP